MKTIEQVKAFIEKHKLENQNYQSPKNSPTQQVVLVAIINIYQKISDYIDEEE